MPDARCWASAKPPSKPARKPAGNGGRRSEKPNRRPYKRLTWGWRQAFRLQRTKGPETRIWALHIRPLGITNPLASQSQIAGADLCSRPGFFEFLIARSGRRGIEKLTDPGARNRHRMPKPILIRGGKIATENLRVGYQPYIPTQFVPHRHHSKQGLGRANPPPYRFHSMQFPCQHSNLYYFQWVRSIPTRSGVAKCKEFRHISVGMREKLWNCAPMRHEGPMAVPAAVFKIRRRSTMGAPWIPHNTLKTVAIFRGSAIRQNRHAGSSMPLVAGAKALNRNGMCRNILQL